MTKSIVTSFIEAGLLNPHGPWHWFRWHFLNMRPLAEDIMRTTEHLDARMPGLAKMIAKRMAETSGREKYLPHYEQLLQQLCELVIARRISEAFPESGGYKLVWEPTEKNKKNPEFMLEGPDIKLLVEVKCPSLFGHFEKVSGSDIQLAARLGDLAMFDAMATNGQAIRPLDNRVKDFLVSAEGKFSTFDMTPEGTYSLLVICWEQRMFEAISPLINPMSGLLTQNSFYVTKEGGPVKFPNLNGVIVTQHLSPLLAATREEPILGTFDSPLDYGVYGPKEPIPNPALIANPYSAKALPKSVIDALYAREPTEISDPIASALDLVFWLPLRPRS